MINLQLSQERVRNGERLTGSMTWSASSAKTPRKLEVVLRWRVEGRPRHREEVVGVVRKEDIARSEVTIPLEFNIPVRGPLSYDGKLFRIIWEVVASADLPMAHDEEEIKAFTVVARKWDPKDFEEGEDAEEGDESSEDVEEESFEVRGANEESRE